MRDHISFQRQLASPSWHRKSFKERHITVTHGPKQPTRSLAGCARQVSDTRVKKENQVCALCGLSPPHHADVEREQGYCRHCGLNWRTGAVQN